ncbi:hypothetical protein H920_09138 [Fukomys damarensis]|uniref:Uncharacterized protein n=1 Tax=Fukomys damarensis TaxID=885580 RepID=A0A091E373_FUKDA|nr:hypothetical protein H920_09138 [Fukomys damarensis]
MGSFLGPPGALRPQPLLSDAWKPRLGLVQPGANRPPRLALPKKRRWRVWPEAALQPACAVRDSFLYLSTVRACVCNLHVSRVAVAVTQLRSFSSQVLR